MVDGWELLDDEARPGEKVAGRVLGFLGRTFRREGLCVTVGVTRPESPDKILRTLAKSDGVLSSDDTTRMTRAAPEAGQATVWLLLPGDHVAMARVFGSTDPTLLDPFVDAIDRSRYEPPDPAAAPCPPVSSIKGLEDPDGEFGPPPECTAP